MKLNIIKLPDGSYIIDGFSKLLVITSGISKDFKYQDHDLEAAVKIAGLLECEATFFVTKKGREAIKIDMGNTHNFYFSSGSCDRNWGKWDERKPVNAFFSEAISTSNGGGCWAEVTIMTTGVRLITSEEQSYMDELS